MEEQTIQMKGLCSPDAGCSTSSSSSRRLNSKRYCLSRGLKIYAIGRKDGALAEASCVENNDDNHPSQLYLKGDAVNTTLAILSGLPHSNGFLSPTTLSPATRTGAASSSGGGGCTDSSSKEEEKEEKNREGSFHHCKGEDEPEDKEGEDISVSLITSSRVAAAMVCAIDGEDDIKQSSHAKYTPSCLEYGREFPSWEADFGHMRCHPESEGRGICPTTEIINSINKYVIFHNPSTGKRSKRCKPRHANPFPLLEFSIEELEAASTLLMLSSGSRTIEEKANNKQVSPSLSSSSSSSLRVLEVTEVQPDSITGNKEEDPSVCVTVTKVADMSEDRKKVGRAMDEDIQRKGKKAVSIGNLTDDEGKYKCSSCKRRFASHQALGGHRASHRKLKGCFAKAITNAGVEERPIEKPESESEDEEEKKAAREEVNTAFLPSPPRPPHPPPSTQINKLHKCQICPKAFETGQALGGHKRCHYNEDRIVKQKKQKKREATTEEEEGRFLLLNLNLPPLLEEEDLIVHNAPRSKNILNPDNLLPQKAKLKKKYYCQLCKETFTSCESLYKHEIDHATSSVMTLALTLLPQ